MTAMGAASRARDPRNYEGALGAYILISSLICPQRMIR